MDGEIIKIENTLRSIVQKCESYLINYMNSYVVRKLPKDTKRKELCLSYNDNLAIYVLLYDYAKKRDHNILWLW